MITRFNEEREERKDNAAGKGKFTTEERLGMGTVSMTEIPYGIAAEKFGVSRTYYYELGQKAEPTLKGIIAATELAESVIVLNKAFRERLVPAPSCYGNVSAENIIAIFEAAFAYPISKGTICNIMRTAEEAERRVSPDGIKNIATDEAFQKGEPVLTGADLDTGYVFPAESAADRSGETWKAAPEDKKARGLNPALNVSDGGSGLAKGVRKAFPAIEARPDIFHAPRDLENQVRRAEELIATLQLGKPREHDKNASAHPSGIRGFAPEN